MKKNYNTPEMKIFTVVLAKDIIQTSGEIEVAEMPKIYDGSTAMSQQDLTIFE